MALIALELLTPGMRLSQPVCNANGVLLLKEGEVLTEKHLQIFKTWGVPEADVVQEDLGGPAASPEASFLREVMERVKEEMAHRFRRVDLSGDPIMAEILRLGTRRVALQRAGQGER